jgi:hypothetical protein
VTGVQSIGRRFAIDGEFVEARRYGSGHINDTFLAVYADGSRTARFIHQRINSRVFPDVPALMENISRITKHLAGESLTLVCSHAGGPYVVDKAGAFWRTYVFLQGARTIDVPESPEQAFDAARAFGRFTSRLADLPGPPLHETIPHFHDTKQRFQTLRKALCENVAGRAALAKDEAQFAFKRASLAGIWDHLRRRGVPQRTVHNDTKISNVLLMEGGAHRVIDLDTVMPGLSLYDFGDMVRSGAASAPEDERDLQKVRVRPEYYRAIVRGFSEGCGSLLSALEREHFLTAAKAIAFEQGIRFLTDYLQGDVYFRVDRPGQNLDRARTQFALLRSLEAGEGELTT